MTDCITEYIRFCEHTTMPTQTVRCFPNNKPWITNDLKALLNKKKSAFSSGDREELMRVQHELRDMLRACKDTYRRKLEDKLQHNNVRDVWTGMKQITGCKVNGRQSSGSLSRANKLNNFFKRFSSQPSVVSMTPPDPHTPSLSQMLPPLPLHSPAVSSPVQHFTSSSSTDDTVTLPSMTVTAGQVGKQLERLHQRKAADPDSISPRVLKTCASQLSPVLQHLYNLSLGQERIPVLSKTSYLVPVPKNSTPSDLNDYPHILM